MSPLDCCAYARAIYDPIPKSTFSIVAENDAIVWGYSPIGNVVSFRGSKTTEDWIRDFEALPQWDSEIGFVDGGFLEGMDDALKAITPLITTGVWMVGHSLGGAHARISAAKLLTRGFRIGGVTVFGSPKPGFINLRRILEKSSCVHSSFRNRNDIVPALPFSLSPLLDYVHTEDWIALDAPPAQDNLEALRDHEVDLYYKGVLALGNQFLQGAGSSPVPNP